MLITLVLPSERAENPAQHLLDVARLREFRRIARTVLQTVGEEDSSRLEVAMVDGLKSNLQFVGLKMKLSRSTVTVTVRNRSGIPWRIDGSASESTVR